ncbi:MAG TPA: TIGR03084 family metal-binding protein [Microthrixaceae bacterium]|nr:TIGR03084 family metal-binding protein [Microthrixaceae bacterium]
MCNSAEVADLDVLLDDLAAEGQELDDAVSGTSDEQWLAPTPAEGWSVAVQIAHLCWTDTVAIQAASDPEAFGAYLDDLLRKTSPERLSSVVDDAAFELAREPRAELMQRWREGRPKLVEALRAVPAGQRVPWFGPPMSAASMATARLMESWAHGQDIFDSLHLTRSPSMRIRNIAHIGARTRDFAFVTNGLPVPSEEFRIELTAPDGTRWTWGPADAPQSVSGPALDFCLLVTQRRHRNDLALRATGADAEVWLDIAQAFAGPPGTGRPAK